MQKEGDQSPDPKFTAMSIDEEVQKGSKKNTELDDVSREKSPKNCQQFIQDGISDLFRWWGKKLAQSPCIIFWISMIFFVTLSCGMLSRKVYEDEQVIWTPENNPSLLSKHKVDDLFTSTNRNFVLM